MIDESLFDKILEIATAAGNQILEVKAAALSQVEKKSDQSPVTIADKKSNDFICAHLKKLPVHATIVAEESDLPAAHSVRGPFWLVDPLDGTKDFVAGTGEYTVNIALVMGNEVQAGVVYVPEKKVGYGALIGNGAFKIENGQKTPIRTRKMTDSPVAMTSRFHKGQERKILSSIYPDLELLDAGSSLKFCRLAEGVADIYLRLWPCSEWDTAAGQIILEEAGGAMFEVPSGRPMVFCKENWLNGSFLAVGDPRISSKILENLPPP